MTTSLRLSPLWILAAALVLFTGCLNPCKKIECQNGGTCDDGVCDCPPGFSGDECTVIAREQFIGVYTASESCDSGDQQYEFRIEQGSGELGVTIHNLYNLAHVLNGTIDGNQITIPQQTFDFITISGNGTHSGGSVNLNFSIRVGTSADPCVLWANKQ